MNHLVHLDYKAREFENLKLGKKAIVICKAMRSRTPYSEVSVNDILNFIKKKGDALKKATGFEEVFNSEKLTKEKSAQLIEKHRDQLVLDPGLLKRFSGKRYIELFTLLNFEVLEPFAFDRIKYSTMDDWLFVENMETVKT